MNKKIYIEASQSLFDISIQEFGSIEGVFFILDANPLLKVDSVLNTGDFILIPERAPLNKKVVDYYESLKIKSSSVSYSFSTIVAATSTIRNSSNSWTQSINCGEDFEVPDSTVIINGLTTISLPSTENINIQVEDSLNVNLGSISGSTVTIPDRLVANSSGSYAVWKPASTFPLFLPNIVVTDSDGSTYNFPSLTNVSCSPQVKDLFLTLNFKDTNDVIEVLGDVNNAGIYTTIPVGLTYSTDGVNYIVVPGSFSMVNTTLYYFKRATATQTESKTLMGTYV